MDDKDLLSFRDPSGRLLTLDGRILRIIHRFGEPNLRAWMGSNRIKSFIQEGRLISAELLNPDEARELIPGQETVVEHEKVSFPSFPYEWPAEMLFEAGQLTLDIAEGLLEEGLGLKDATPYNILFRGSKPVFIDMLSVEQREPGDCTWLPYAQFVRTFLLPLLVNRHLGIPPHQSLITHRDGLQPEEVHRISSLSRKLWPPFLALVSIPTWLAARHAPDDSSLYRKKTLKDPEKANFILKWLFRDLRRTLNRLVPDGRTTSVWSGYMASRESYSEDEFAQKSSFIDQVLEESKPQDLLDLGCNTGHFSFLAARKGARVVAVDSDPVVVGQVWRKAREEGLDILPLVVDISRPSPALGWRNQEHPSFLERAQGAFGVVLMLAILHHLLVTERIPLPEILDMAADLTSDLLVIEFVSPDDPQFQRIARGRDALFGWLTLEAFEDTCRRHFTIVRSRRLGEASRWLYLLRKMETHRADA